MNPIKKSLKRLAVLGCMVYTVVTLVNGCASPNPNAGQVTVTTNPSTGASTTNVAPAYIPNTNLTAIVGTVGTINTATSAIDPYSGIISLLLGITTVIGGGLAAYKNSQANGLTTQLTSVIQGVEAATTDATGTTLTTPIAAAAVKAAITKKATAAGVQPALNTLVQKVTS